MIKRIIKSCAPGSKLSEIHFLKSLSFSWNFGHIIRKVTFSFFLLILLSCPKLAYSGGSALTLDNRFVPVSIASYGKDQFIIADYKKIYIFSISKAGNSFKEIPLVSLNSSKLNHTIATTTLAYENPTGVCYDPDKEILYIANYNHHNILRVSLKGSPLYGEIVERMTHPDLVSPENVSVKNDYIAVADYDGSAVFLFNSKTFKLLWKNSLTLAHGILITNDAVYASGLGSEKLVKYSLDGKELARGGQDLLYPTSITRIDDNRIAVIDANLGIIITYDTNFKELERKGCNGPLPEEYHRPYGIASSDGNLAIADTYKGRILIYNEAEKAITDIVEMLPHIVSVGKKLDYGKAPLYQCSSQVVPQVFMELMRSAYKLPPDLTARVGYQTFCLLLGNDIYTSALTPYDKPDFAVKNRPSTPLGFTWMHEFKIENRSFIILGASDNLSAMVFDGKTKTFHQILLPSGLQVWSVDEIYRPFIESLATDAIKKFDALVEKCHGNVFVAYILSFITPTTKDDKTFYSILSNLFVWSDPQPIIQKWKEGKPIKEALADWIEKKNMISIDDAILINLMSQTSAEEALKEFKQN